MAALFNRRIRPWTVKGLLPALSILCLGLGLAYAEDFHLSAQHLSDSAFAILNSLSADSGKLGASDVIGAMASFAGDAQTLSTALAKGDRDGAGAAMSSLLADRRSVDDALVKNPNTLDASKWASLKAELAEIQPRVPAASASMAKASPPESRSEIVRPPASEAAATVPDGSAPQVEITSRVSDDSGLHIKGYLQGTNLKSAGIYDGDAMIQKIDLAPTADAQRVLLDLKLEQVSSTETIRVADMTGREAAIHIATDSTPVVESGGHEKMIELGGGSAPSDALPSDAPPVDLASRDPRNTAEIPSESPSRRHLHGNDNLAPLSDVQINILGVQKSLSESSSYQVIGQISGNNVKRAGIYIDGRLVKPIAVTPGGDTSFNVAFIMFGNDASIRAYGLGSNYVESSIDLSTANGTVYGAYPPAAVYAYPVNPYARNPYGYPASPYGAPPGYGAPGYPNGGYPYNGYPNNGYPPPSRPWWSKIF
jgi:hypothetical protein